jgi:hypothetical protein
MNLPIVRSAFVLRALFFLLDLIFLITFIKDYKL